MCLLYVCLLKKSKFSVLPTWCFVLSMQIINIFYNGLAGAMRPDPVSQTLQLTVGQAVSLEVFEMFVIALPVRRSGVNVLSIGINRQKSIPDAYRPRRNKDEQ